MAQNRQKLRKLIENDTRGSVPATVSLGVTKKENTLKGVCFLFAIQGIAEPKWVRSTSVGLQTPRKRKFAFPLLRGRNP